MLDVAMYVFQAGRSPRIEPNQFVQMSFSFPYVWIDRSNWTKPVLLLLNVGYSI